MHNFQDNHEIFRRYEAAVEEYGLNPGAMFVFSDEYRSRNKTAAIGYPKFVNPKTVFVYIELQNRGVFPGLLFMTNEKKRVILSPEDLTDLTKIEVNNEF